MRNITEVARTLKVAYNEQYDDEILAWREIGGKYKAENIIRLSKGYGFSKVMECGAGEGSILKHLERSSVFKELYAIEISESGIDQIKKRNIKSLKEVKLFNGYEMPYKDLEFDMVYCSHVLEHVEFPRVLLREIKRVSRFQIFEIPLDYSISVDNSIDHFLSYGHINIYTPSLFRFLLKSEGFEIINDHLSHINKEVLRFNMYRNLKLKKTFLREMKMFLEPAGQTLRKLKMGKVRYDEFCYHNYTCLTSNKGELQIF